MGGRFDKKVIVPYERKRKYRERNAQSRRGGSIHHFHKSDMKFLSDSTSERIMRAVNGHPNNTNINMRFQMLGRMNAAITIISGSLGIARNASTILMIKKPTLSK